MLTKFDAEHDRPTASKNDFHSISSIDFVVVRLCPAA